MGNGRELRVFPLQEIEVRAAEGESPAMIRGYAAVFDTWSTDLGGFVERIMPGAFAESIQKDDIRALWNHNPDWPLGRNRAGTLMLEEDEHGLLVAITPPDTSWANDLIVSMKRGDVDQMSFGFMPLVDQWEDPPADGPRDAPYRRTLFKAQLYDVSTVTFPAYAETEAHVRAMGYDVITPDLPQGRQGGEGNAEDDDGQGPRQIVHLRRLVEIAEVEM